MQVSSSTSGLPICAGGGVEGCKDTDPSPSDIYHDAPPPVVVVGMVESLMALLEKGGDW